MKNSNGFKKWDKEVARVDLKLNLFVRQALDTDRVVSLAELIEAGIELDRIITTADNTVIDGRHRIEAYELAGVEAPLKVEVWDVDSSDVALMISLAYQANLGGALPPKAEDTEHTVLQLLQLKKGYKVIADLLHLPPSLAKRYVDKLVQKQKKLRLQQAVTAVADEGLTMAKAAERFAVEPEDLKQIIQGHKKKAKDDVVQIGEALTSRFRSVGQQNSRLVQKLFAQYQDGDLSEAQVRDVLKRIRSSQAQAAKTLAEQERRFDALTKK